MLEFDPDRYLTLDELLDRIEVARRQYAPLRELEPIPSRTLRFYTQQGLLPRVARGRGKKYPAGFVWKVLFIRLLTQRHQLKLAHIHSAMRSVDVETMRRVATGEEPLEVAAAGDTEAIAHHAGKGKVVALDEREGRGPRWRVMHRSEDAVLRVRAGLPPAKMRQLIHIAALLKALVEK